MPTVYQGFKPIDFNDDEYRIYMQNFVNQPTDPNQRPGAMPAFETNTQGGLSPVSQEPKAGSLESYYGGYNPTAYGQVGQYAAQATPSIMAAYAAGPYAPAVGLYMYGMGLAANAIHGDSWTPDKYKTLTAAERNDYLDNTRNPTARARDFSEMSSMNQNDNPRLIDYLSQVQVYEDPAFYNPGEGDIAGRYRAHALNNWAKQRIASRWQSDMDAIEAQRLSQKYNIPLPQYLQGREPFRVNFPGGRY